MSKNYIELETGKIYGIPIAGGVLRIDVSVDELYPGVDIEFLAANGEENLVTKPRVLIEAPIDDETKKQENLRVLIWGDAYSEDYSESVEFQDEQLNKRDSMRMAKLSFTDEIGYTEFQVSQNWLNHQKWTDAKEIYHKAAAEPELSFFVS